MISMQLQDWLLSLSLGSIVIIFIWYFKSPQKLMIIPITPTPYNEDAIVASIKEIYSIFIKLSYISPETIAYTPPSGHDIDESLCSSLNIDPRVVSLMKRLPYPVSLDAAEGFEIIPGSRAAVYTNNDDLKYGRGEATDAAEQSLSLKPYDIILIRGSAGTGNWMLDTQQNTIRCILQPSSSPSNSSGKFILDTPEQAPVLLGQWISNFRKLEWLTCGSKGRKHIAIPDVSGYFKVKKILEDGYDWPYAFREEDWARHQERIWRESTRS